MSQEHGKVTGYRPDDMDSNSDRGWDFFCHYIQTDYGAQPVSDQFDTRTFLPRGKAVGT